MFFRTFMVSLLLVTLGASLYVDEVRQAPATIRPEGGDLPQIVTLPPIYPEARDDPPPIVPKQIDGIPPILPISRDTPPIVPKEIDATPPIVVGPKLFSGSCQNVNYGFTASGQSTTLSSQYYPFSYPYNSDCSNFYNSPPGTQMTFQCDTFNVACPNDYLSVSLDGSPTLAGANSYCSQGVIPLSTTTGNSLSIGFHSSNSRPFSWSFYNYRCKITVIGTAGPTTTPGPNNPSTVPPPGPTNNCTCGIRNVNGAASTRIVGGVETKAGEIPWRVTVFVYDPTTGQGGICGGSIISKSWVMTAAHCTMDFESGYLINVYAGAQANPVTVGGGTTYVVDRYVQHPSFNRRTLDNDITLLHISTPITFQANVGPACLPFPLKSSDFGNGISVLASGWGTTKPVPAGANNTDDVSSTLMEVTLPVLSTAQCRQYQSVTDNQICTYQPGSDTCQGDSGGSIDYQYTDGRYYAIGVVSYGIGCAQTNWPGVYTKVTNYLSWIQVTTLDNTLCPAP